MTVMSWHEILQPRAHTALTALSHRSPLYIGNNTQFHTFNTENITRYKIRFRYTICHLRWPAVVYGGSHTGDKRTHPRLTRNSLQSQNVTNVRQLSQLPVRCKPVPSVMYFGYRQDTFLINTVNTDLAYPMRMRHTKFIFAMYKPEYILLPYYCSWVCVENKNMKHFRITVCSLCIYCTWCGDSNKWQLLQLDYTMERRLGCYLGLPVNHSFCISIPLPLPTLYIGAHQSVCAWCIPKT